MKAKQHTFKFLDWMVSHGVDRFDLAASREPNNGPWLPGVQHANASTVKHSQEWCWLENLSGWERQKSRIARQKPHWTPDDSGAEICIRPARVDGAGNGCGWPMVLLDDLSVVKAFAVTRKYAACAVETSADNCQVWLHVSRPLNEAERYQVQSWLSSKIDSDRGSLSGEHHGRLPGYRNRKPNRNDEWCNVLAATNGPAFNPSVALTEIADLELEFAPLHSPSSTAQKLAKSGVVVSREYVDDESRKEFGWAVAAFRRGVPRSQILDDLTDRAANRRGRRDALRYAMRTVERAERAAM